MILARFFGIRLRVNLLFSVLLLVYALAGLLIEALILFAVVMLHELWHAVVAAGYGFDIDEIELMPFGGVARLKGLIEVDPVSELKMAIAGPISSVAIAATSFGLAYRLGQLGPYMGFFILSNLSVGLFNLVPIIPLDGGRALRAALVMRQGFVKGTRIALRVSGVIFIVMAAGIAGAIYLGILALPSAGVLVFLYIAQRRERSNSAYIFLRYLVNKESEILSDRILAVEQLVATKDVTVREVLLSITPQKYHMVVVLDSDLETIGTISEKQLLDSFMYGNADVPIEVLL